MSIKKIGSRIFHIFDDGAPVVMGEPRPDVKVEIQKSGLKINGERIFWKEIDAARKEMEAPQQ